MNTIASPYQLKNNDLVLGSRKYVLRIRDLPEDEKPREKMLAQGVDSLKLSDLLAVVLSTGTKKGRRLGDDF